MPLATRQAVNVPARPSGAISAIFAILAIFAIFANQTADERLVARCFRNGPHWASLGLTGPDVSTLQHL
ncbi:hypothetical protein UVI_02012080 [Ustilaginoidea virens]|uniref:Uncharacterized protein n=1 Tax=Ustilaginoidea virens TaxID=1159556 RepID=A0A1B5L0M4_USTVR|nr:hypothetical protein UVI_02012080 [Ustilaginoidea virens]